MAFCTKCGTALDSDSRFCANCGAEVRSASQPSGQPAPQHSPQAAPAVGTAVQTAAKGGSILKWIVALVILAGAVTFVFIRFDIANLFKSDETLIRERIQALEDAFNQADWEGILECLDGPTQAAMELTMDFSDGLLSELTGFDLGLRDMFALGGAFMTGDEFRLVIKDIQIEADRAAVTVVMVSNMYELEQAEEAQLPMIKEDGDWYVSGFDDLMGYWN